MSKKLFICKNCGKSYYSYKDNSKFCSMECKNKFNNIPYYCDYCGKEIIVARSRIDDVKNGKRKGIYCCRECASKSQITSTIKKCSCCGKPFKVENGLVESKKYCSMECYDSMRKKKIKYESKICPICNKEFKTYHHNQVYCSIECSGIAQRKRLLCKCDNCGTLFDRKISEIDNANHHFCSNECRFQYSRWNEKDISIMRTYYGNVNIHSIKDMLSKQYSIKQINTQAIKLGLSKDRTWSEEEINKLVENYSNVPLNELIKILPNRSIFSIKGKAKTLGLQSYAFLKKYYSDDDINFIKNNYDHKTIQEIALVLKRTPYAIEQKIYGLGLERDISIKKSGCYNLDRFMRSRLNAWKQSVRESCNYTCSISGKRSNIIVHHCRSFNTIMEEVIELLDFPIYDDLDDYTDDQLNEFAETFLDLQDYYGEYACVSNDIHILFHKEYGYGNNTQEQWDEFVNRYKSGYYNN